MIDALLPLSDQAALVVCPDEQTALHLAASVRRTEAPWFIDVVQAYQSVAVFFDLERTCFAQVSEELRSLDRLPGPGTVVAGTLHRVPCCYEHGPDLRRVAELTGQTAEQVIEGHAGTIYTVYAIGFCPGFPYLGYLPAALCGVPRLTSPRLSVPAGSVGLTGRQTGIYTETRPGGWNLIGRTPLELVHVGDGYFPLRTGDRVQFQRIDTTEFAQLRSQRL